MCQKHIVALKVSFNPIHTGRDEGGGGFHQDRDFSLISREIITLWY